MTQTLFAVALLLVCCTSIDGVCTRKTISSIATGTSFGMCMGYCRQSVNVTGNRRQLVAAKEANYVQDQYPSVQKTYAFSADEWQQLTSLVDVKSFEALTETIGCPDCADGGAEWIEIRWNTSSKRVTFEFRQTIKGFEGLINELRRLREKYQADL